MSIDQVIKTENKFKRCLNYLKERKPIIKEATKNALFLAAYKPLFLATQVGLQWEISILRSQTKHGQQ